ncbi:hypothetical protein FA13DRAFT_1815793 [Coprinellus micaceus]|uniref:Phosphatidylglycerol/phosphatidylinositol transfer protein n=1 Tax=Coprinellus micaceus TaxID=71717 RepID=A0A4Y7T2P1_COPMI|nr:hypothetical protein FA13DRAFT_1815793 [Coprinellus micaceus]
MRFSLSSLFVPLACVASALAQASVIQLPASGASIANGAPFTVQVAKPLSHQGSREAGFVIALLPCYNNGVCPPPTQELGRILYNGPYTPTLQDQPGRPYQNFEFTMPPADEIQKGPAQLATVRLHLFGATAYPEMEVHSIPITVV